ncbi:hypothetical protein [Rhodoferax sp. TS-BS-61-7]|uniref:hypothetical protein n=1 Tax=Rhodoferax sp. TS-BS-61-7 TaxID=2094194 RepID=UPI000CF71791|nr:hypothetical protein [Rhodoferax sp. TS-BS-61-7]PQA78713.1 hypothetical protein C5F53_01670 [Rhodoferax sp. TS-BS-61-7]
MNCCNDYAHCTRGNNCPARGTAMQIAGAAHIDMTGLSTEEPYQAATAEPDTHEAARDVQPDYMTPWEWIADLARSAVAAAVAAALMGMGMGFVYGRWIF